MLRRCRQFVPLILLLASTSVWGVELLPTDPKEQAQYWLEHGVKEAQEERYTAAIEAINKALKLDPRLPSAYYNLGFIYHQMGKPAKAVGYYYEALKLDPSDIQAQRGLGLAYAAQNKWQQAAAVFADLLRKQPDDAEAALQLGAAYLRLEQSAKAIAPLQQATKLRADDPLAHLYLAQALTLTDRLAEAELHLLKARKLKPDSEQIKRELLRFYVESGRFLSAEPLAKELVAKHPRDQQLLAAQVKIYEGLGLSRERRQAQEALLDQLPQQEALAARAQLADEYLVEGRYEQALPYLEMLHQARPKDAGFTATLVRCYLNLGRQQRALEVLEKALKQGPPHPELATMLGDLHLGREELSKALEAYEQALAAERDYLPALRAACQIGAQLGLTAQTVPWLRRLVALTPQDPLARMMLADQLALAGKFGAAMYQFNQVVGNSGDEELVEGARFRLMALAQRTGNDAYEEQLQRDQSRQTAATDRDTPADLLSDDADLQATKERIEGLISRNPDDLDIKALLGEFYLETEELDQAAAVLREILAGDPQHAQANYLMGRVEQERQSYAAALAYLRTAILGQPSARESYDALVACAEANNSLAEAGDFLTAVLADVLGSEQDVEHAIHLIVTYLARISKHTDGEGQAVTELAALSDAFPRSAALALEVARVMVSAGEVVAAGRYYERAARSPKYGQALAEAALLQLEDHPGAALAAANGYLVRVVQDDEALALVVELQVSTKQLTEAHKGALARLLDRPPQSADYEIAKVALLRLAGRLVQAEANLAVAVLAEPDNWALRAALAYTLWLQGRPADALTQLERIPTEAGTDPGLRTFKATVLAEAGYPHKALDELGQALVAQPRDLQAALLRASVLHEVGRYEEALWEFCQVLILDPEIADAGASVVAMVKEGSPPWPMVLTALSYTYAVTGRPEVIRDLVLQLANWGDQAAVEQWLVNHPRRLGEGG